MKQTTPDFVEFIFLRHLPHQSSTESAKACDSSKKSKFDFCHTNWTQHTRTPRVLHLPACGQTICGRVVRPTGAISSPEGPQVCRPYLVWPCNNPEGHNMARFKVIIWTSNFLLMQISKGIRPSVNFSGTLYVHPYNVLWKPWYVVYLLNFFLFLLNLQREV